jgi:hypothetical protein
MTSHDVRKLQTCVLCKGLGIHRPVNPGIGWPLVICVHSDAVQKKWRSYAHPSCYLEEMGIRKLLSLPVQELRTIRICDVPMRAMQAILKQFKDAA